MGYPVFLQDNVYSLAQYGGHTLSANEEAPGFEAHWVGRGRRSGLNYWTPVTENQDAWLQVTMDQPRTVDMISLERGHNLAGETIQLQRSADEAFTTPITVWTLQVPAAPAQDSDLNALPGVTLAEGAWIYRFSPAVVAEYVRLFIPAMGVGARPQVVGLQLGESWRPLGWTDKPFGHGDRELIAEEATTPSGWTGRTKLAQRRRRSWNMRLAEGDEANAERHLENGFWRNRPMWVVMDENRAEKAWKAIPPLGSYGLQQTRDWSRFQGRIDAVEQDPLVP